ncbi:MAG: hypothetical protein K1000chlam1_00975 [Candidatus Anoxychlamydiales bacterium]|nr:hypothetical protein [Candidatus Anoxychlamydiales bacterium]
MRTTNCSDTISRAGKAVVSPFFQTPMRSAATISSISSLAAYFIFDCSLNNSAYTGLAIITVAGAIRYFSNLNKPSIPKAPPPPPLGKVFRLVPKPAAENADSAGAEKTSKGVVATPPAAKKGAVHRAPEAGKKRIEDDMTLLLSFPPQYRLLTTALSYANEPSNATRGKLRSKCEDLQVDWDKFRKLFQDFPGSLDRYHKRRLDGLKELIPKDTALKSRPLPPTPAKKFSPRGRGKPVGQTVLSSIAPKPIPATSPKQPEMLKPKKFPKNEIMSLERKAFLLQESLTDDRSTVTTVGMRLLQNYCSEFGINWEDFTKLAQLGDQNKRLEGLQDLVSIEAKKKYFQNKT